MKKFLSATLVVLAMTSTAVAQEYPDFNDTKNSFEIGFNPFANNFNTFRIKDGGAGSIDLKYRRFFGQNALRVRLGFEIDNKKQTAVNNITNNNQENLIGTTNPITSNTTNQETTTTTNSFKFGIFVGYERHFEIGERLDLYAGAEVGYCIQNGSQKTEINESGNSRNLNYYNVNNPNAGYTLNTTNYTESSVDETKKNNSYGEFAANVFTGLDVSIWKGLYLGAELGLGLSTKSYKTPERTYTYTRNETAVAQVSNPGTTTTTTTITTINRNTDADGNYRNTRLVMVDNVAQTNTVDTGTNYNTTKDRSEFNLKLYVNPSLRIGWRF